MCILLENIKELVTFEPLVKEDRITSICESDLGLVKNAWVFIENNKIVSTGTHEHIEKLNKIKEKADTVIDLQGSLVLPGLVDSHTHTIFSGDRYNEFSHRLNGKSYQEIAESGGGINSTVRSTRETSSDTLRDLTKHRLQKMLTKGVTTVEIKSGYGLSVQEELRLLRILKKVSKECKQNLAITCLALHALPKGDDKNYIYKATNELLPAVAEEGLATFVDAFIEKGYFSVNQVEPYIERAKSLGLGIRLHVDEFSDGGGALAAASWGASSADHLQFASKKGIEALANSGCVATILPGTSLYTGIPFTNATSFTESGCAVAVASDFNPGSCYLYNLAQLVSIAAVHCHLTSSQALAAVTRVPAVSLGLREKGALTTGLDADLLIYKKFKDHRQWLSDMGQSEPCEVWVGGKRS